MISHNLGCWTIRASDGPCNACATHASARCVCVCCHHHHHHNAPYYAACVTLLLAKVIASLLRPLNGQMRQLQTNNPWQNTCAPDWHTPSTHEISQIKGGIVRGLIDQPLSTL